MKLIFVNRFFYPDHSATAQMLTDLAFDLADMGWPVHVVTSRLRYDDPTADLPAVECQHGVHIHRVWTPRFGRSSLIGRLFDYAGFYLMATRQLWQTTARGDMVIAKTDPPLISVPAAWVARRRDAKLINWLQDLFPEVARAAGIRGLSGRIYILLKKLRNRSLAGATANVAIGRRMREILLAAGSPADRVHIIPNWADGEAIRPIPQAQNTLRDAWGLEGKFVVGYSGNMGRTHEFDTMLDAAERLLDQLDICFLFIGAGAQKGHVEAEVAKRQLSNVVFKPYQPRDQLHLSLSCADAHIAVLRPEFEGLVLPSKIYGILAAGRPLLFIGDPEGDTATEFVASGAALACPIGDASSLAANVLRIRDTLHGPMGRQARRTLEDSYERKRVARKWDQLLRHSE